MYDKYKSLYNPSFGIQSTIVSGPFFEPFMIPISLIKRRLEKYRMKVENPSNEIYELEVYLFDVILKEDNTNVLNGGSLML